MHLDRHPDIVTQQVERTVEGRKFYSNCDKAEAKHTTSSLFVDVHAPQDDEEEEPQEYSLSASDPQNQSNEDFRGLGGRIISMTQFSLHTFAYLTGSSFRLKAKLLPNKN